MVAIKPETISKLKNYATTQFNKRVANPQEGTIFDACNKLGIKNTDDLKAGFELFKENPTEAIGTAYNELREKGFTLNTDYNRERAALKNKPEKSVQNKPETAKTTQTTNTVKANEDTEEVAEEAEEETTDNSVKGKEQSPLEKLAEKLGIKNSKDLEAAMAKLKANPNETAQSAVSKLGGSEELAAKVGKLATKFFA